MTRISLERSFMTNPELRESVRAASSKDRIRVLNNAGFSNSEIEDVAERISNSHVRSMFKNRNEGKLGSFDCTCE